MKLKNSLFLFGLFGFFTVLTACNNDDGGDDNTDGDLELVGQEGNPRFNLQFTNGEAVDLDLYVETPDGSIIYYANPSADGGQLDVDCMCGGCPQGPNENIYWENGTAPSGTYKYYIEYFGGCDDDGVASDYTLRVIRNGEVLTTKTGTLTGGETTHWEHVQE